MVDIATGPTVTLWSRVCRAWRRNGAFGLAKLIALNVRLLISGSYSEHAYAYDRSFDLQYGIDTAGTMAVEELDAPANLKQSASRYEAAEPDFVNFLIARLGLDSPEKYLFVDVGCGKGRVLVLAALAGFSKVVGLEIDRKLANIARSNLERVRTRCLHARFSVVEGSATSFSFPPVPTVLFLNNPFDEQLISKLLDAIELNDERSGAEVIILYMHSLHAEFIRARPGWDETQRGVFRNSRQFYSILRRAAN